MPFAAPVTTATLPYSKKIFAKTGAKRQAELVTLILRPVSLLGGLDPPLRDPQP